MTSINIQIILTILKDTSKLGKKVTSEIRKSKSEEVKHLATKLQASDKRTGGEHLNNL